MSEDLSRIIDQLQNDFDAHHKKGNEAADKYKKVTAEIATLKASLAKKEKEAADLMDENKRSVEEKNKIHAQIEQYERKLEEVKKALKKAA